jgi:acetylornithine deacetylase
MSAAAAFAGLGGRLTFPDAERVLRAVDDAADLRLLQEMVRIRSYSDGGEESRLAEHLVTQMRELGLEARLMEVEPGRFNAVGVLRGAGGGQSLMFNGHMDTNPIGIGWTVDPLAAETRDGFVFGIGVSNMKASCAAFLGAVRALVHAREPLRGDVVLAYVVGELQGGIGTLKLLNEGVRADQFIVGEPTDMAVLTLHAGALSVEIDALGVTRHLSKMEESVSAIDLMYRVINRLSDVTFTGPSDPEAASVQRINVGSMKAGLGKEYHDWRPGQVPDVATIRMSVRFGPGQTEESVLEDLRGVLAIFHAEDPRVDVVVRSARAANAPLALPFRVSQDEPIVKAVVANHERIRGFRPPVGALAPMRYYGTDASHLQSVGGMTGVVCGVGGKYNTMPDERIEVGMFHDAARIYALTALDVCQ